MEIQKNIEKKKLKNKLKKSKIIIYIEILQEENMKRYFFGFIIYDHSGSRADSKEIWQRLLLQFSNISYILLLFKPFFIFFLKVFFLNF